MKKNLILFVLIFLCKIACCQVNLNGTEDHVMIVSLGADRTFINNPAFNSWAETNYNRKIDYVASFSFDLNIVLNYADMGIDLNAGSPYINGSVYYGRRLTSMKSAVSSFLNIELGGFFAAPRFAPANYTPTPDEQGKKLELHYSAAYIGLSSRNYLNKLHFKKGKGKNAVSFNPGFNFEFGYEPWGGDWRYGYYKGSGKSAQFISNKVYNVPALGNVFFNAGISLGIGN